MTSLRWLWWLLCVICVGCASTTDELRGIADRPPLDCAVLVTGGAFLTGAVGVDSTFGAVDGERVDDLAEVGGEAFPFAAIIDVLQRGAVFRRVVADDDDARRLRLRDQLAARAPNPEMIAFLQQARADGFDLLLVVEEVQDGPIDNQGTNGRWPVTFATWILLGVGMLIPDRTFESRATLRVSIRELQTGFVLHDLPLAAGRWNCRWSSAPISGGCCCRWSCRRFGSETIAKQ